MRMFRFSCFPAHTPSHGHKKTVQMSGDGMRKVSEDSSSNKPMSQLARIKTDSVTCFNVDVGGVKPNKIAESGADYSPVERECKSDGSYNADSGSIDLKNAAMRKSISLGCVMNWEERSIIPDGSENDEQKLCDNISADTSVVAIADATTNRAPTASDKCHELAPSVSVDLGSDITKNISVFSIVAPQLIEKENADNDDFGPAEICSSAPHVKAVFGSSRSLPSIRSPSESPQFFLPRSRSAEDFIISDSRKTSIGHELRRQNQFEETEKIPAENTADNIDENFHFEDSAIDWIIPEADGENMNIVAQGDNYYCQPSGEASSGDFKLKRIEQWVTNLQHTGPQDIDESAPSGDHQEFLNIDTLSRKPVSLKFDVNITPGAEVAKRYISSLNPSATTAQLSNLGLVLIPFLSAFVSLKALNLSGNAIVKIAAGALPRGLHILNLSKNNISTIEGLRDLTRLRVLDLSYNRILRIGHGLSGCASLKELYLAGNKISEVEGLHRLLKLNVLDLRFNKISTTKSLDQLAANYNCLHAISLEGNPAQKNIGDEQLKKHILCLLPNLTYYNRQSVKVGTMKDGTDRSARLGIGSHQMDRGSRVEVKNMRKGTAGRRVVPAKTGTKQVRPPPSGMRTAAHHIPISKSSFSVSRSRSEGNLGAL